jgi:hypothetical protein
MYSASNTTKARYWWRLLLTAAVIALFAPAIVAAAPPAQDSGCAEEYTVQADDWLSKLAEKYLGNALDYPLIAEATNKAHEADSRFAQIGDHDLIEVGWLLCIPPALEAEATPEAAATTEPEATTSEPQETRIQFEAGGTTANVDSSIPAKGMLRYVIQAGEGQLMWASLMTDADWTEAGPPVIMAIWGKDGTVLISDHAEATDWSGTLPSTQDYYIDVMSSDDKEITFTLSVAVPAPAETDASLTKTDVINFQPTMPDGPAQEGDCWTSSNYLLRTDAWRCNVGDNQIADPCFSVEGNADVVICGADPVTGDPGYQLKLTKPLPTDMAPVVDPDQVRTDAWYVKLADGKICSVVGGATFGAFGQRANYSCYSDEDPQDLWIFGDLMPNTVWQGVQGLATTADDGMPTGADLKLVQIATVWQ